MIVCSVGTLGLCRTSRRLRTSSSSSFRRAAKASSSGWLIMAMLSMLLAWAMQRCMLECLVLPCESPATGALVDDNEGLARSGSRRAAWLARPLGLHTGVLTSSPAQWAAVSALIVGRLETAACLGELWRVVPPLINRSAIDMPRGSRPPDLAMGCA